jgi:hypothetical protein
METTATPRRTRLSAASMALGGVLLAVPPFLGPPNGADGTRERLTDLAANSNVTFAKSIVFQAAVILLLPGVAAIVGRTRGRGSVAVLSGAAVYGAGIVGAFGFMLMNGVEASLPGNGPINATLVAADDRMGSSPAAMPMYVLAFLMFHLIGLPWLTFGMVRARQIPWWLATVATVGTGCAFFGSGSHIETVGWVVLGISLATIAASLVGAVSPQIERHPAALRARAGQR